MEHSSPLLLRRSEPVGRGVPRIVLGHLAAAQRCLRGTTVSEAATHELRRQIKRARAALRLLRPGVKAGEFRAVDAQLARCAARWSALRDMQVLRPQLRALGLLALAPALSATLPRSARSARVTSAARAEMQAAIAQFAALAVTGADWQMLEAGLRRSYRHGRRAMRKALSTRRDEDWHRWRRNAKHLALQLAMLQAWHSPPIRRIARDAGRLERILGEDHDLAVLLERLHEQPDFRDQQRSQVLQQRERLQRSALAIGKSLYAEAFRHLRRKLRRERRDWQGGR